MSYVYDQYVFHYIVEKQLTFLCMADESFKRRVPFAFLDDVKDRWFATYGDRGSTAIAFAMNEDGRTLKKQVEFYNGPEADQFATVHKKLDDVKSGVMVQNIVEMVLERGEKLELLVDKSEQLQLDAFPASRGPRSNYGTPCSGRRSESLRSFIFCVVLYDTSRSCAGLALKCRATTTTSWSRCQCGGRDCSWWGSRLRALGARAGGRLRQRCPGTARCFFCALIRARGLSSRTYAADAVGQLRGRRLKKCLMLDSLHFGVQYFSSPRHRIAASLHKSFVVLQSVDRRSALSPPRLFRALG